MLKKSFGLIEVIVSIVVLTIGIGGAIAVLNNITSHFRLATDTFIANNLAIEGIELVRNVRNNNLLAGNAWNLGLVGTWEIDYLDNIPLTTLAHGFVDGNLYIDAGNFFQHTTTPNLTPFRRRIEIVSCPDIDIVDCLQVRSIVSWTDTIGGQNVVVVTRLFRGRDI